MTNIGGTIPTEIGRLNNLQRLEMGHLLALDNVVTPHGTVPTEIGNCRNLVALAFEATRITGTIPSEIGNLSSLATLYFTSGGLTGSIPDSLQNLTNLNSLDLQGNSLTGTLPEWLGTLLERLRLLTLVWNNFTGSIPVSLCRASLDLLYDCHQSCDCCGLCGPVD